MPPPRATTRPPASCLSPSLKIASRSWHSRVRKAASPFVAKKTGMLTPSARMNSSSRSTNRHPRRPETLAPTEVLPLAMNPVRARSGAIAPGLMISVEALFQKASKLPWVEIVKPPGVIAKNTVNSMQAGIFYGYVGLVDEIVGRMKRESRENPKVIATGGLASLVAPESKTIDAVEEYLTLEGLRILYLRNRDA